MLSQNELKNLLRYNPETGKLYWKPRPAEMFKTARDGKSWNTRRAEKEAFTCASTRKYLVGRIHNRKYFAHRIIWQLVYGNISKYIDHIDGNTSNNRIKNLRECTSSQNQYNRKASFGSSSKFKGVFWHKKTSKWEVQISVNGERKYLGLFTCEVEAAKAYDAVARKMHGEFYVPNLGVTRQ